MLSVLITVNQPKEKYNLKKNTKIKDMPELRPTLGAGFVSQ